ncbi:MAG TPA: FAD-binding oxidoreductase [Gaiellaceae bacterium]|nr:FAD-binding oxidoreductase [Gaiellaceae bacterium]
MTSIAEEAAELAAQVAGPVFVPGDDGYAAECAVYNLNLALEPALIVGVTSEADVQAAVRFAARRGLPLAVNHTGHHVVHAAHGAASISTQRMNGVTIDADRRTARIEPGVRWGQVISEASEFGLAPMNGSSPTVGSIGYSLGGGQSVAWSRSKGYAADHIVSLDVVTADGVLRDVTADSEPELFWALRGGMGNFGVVTAMVCELFPQTRIFGGGVWFAIEHVPEVMPAWRAWVETLPEEATTSVAVQRLPPLPELPPPLQGASVLHMRFTHLGSAAEGEQLFAPMRALAPAVLDTVAEMPYTSIGTVHMDPPEPIPYWDRTMMFADLPEEAVDEFVALTGPGSECPLISVEIRQLGGAMDREPAVPNAVSTRGLPFVMFAFGVGGPDEEELMRGYLAKLIEVLEPWSAGRMMVNFLSAEEATTPKAMRAAYGAERYDRLLSVKKSYDPLNLFRINHNIVPA